MSVLHIEFPDELARRIDSRASELDTDPERLVAAIIREKFKMPVKIGDLEVFVPADILEYELERIEGESDEEYEATKATFDAIFSAALK